LEKIIPTLSIEKLIFGGNGLGHHDGKAVFVPMTLPGEVVEVAIVREKKDYAEGVVRQLLKTSPERSVPPCPVFGVCGGCQLQHLSDEAQIRHKTEVANEFIGKVRQEEPFTSYPILSSPSPLHYRLRAQLAIQNGQIGFYQKRSHVIVPIMTCPLLAPPLNAALAFLAGDGMASLTGISEVEIQGTDTGELLIILIGQGFSHDKRRSFFKLATAALSPLSLRGLIVYDRGKRFCLGDDALTYKVRNKTMRVSDRSFIQIHGPMHNLLVETVLGWAEGEHNRWLELHAGVGMFTLHLAERAESLTTIDADSDAVKDARFNLAAAGIKNVQLFPGRTEMRLSSFSPGAFTHVFLDPPRGGITKKEIAEIIRLAPQRIFYLSCDPPTLARDIRSLCQEGCRIKRMQPFDLFPQTSHLEMLVELVLP
jgi:23S rRNA (uracil1939-C5)-methyltransferase